MMVAAISLVGCGEKTTTTEVQATPEPTEAPATTEEPEQEETYAAADETSGYENNGYQSRYAQENEEDLFTSDEEDLSKGELNPYTGHEYESNTVRMHPKRIGYVQVYDRGKHQWTDMTEWAFLGYQERKKALLGKDYEPPIYLD